MLAAHPKITSFPESKFFTRLLPNQDEPKRYALGLASGKVQAILEDFFKEVGHPELLKALPLLPQFVGRYARLFVKILDRLALEQGKQIWLEKTPEHLHWLDYIEKTVPQVKIIHILRNGADVVASIYQLAQRDPQRWRKCADGIDASINRWIRDMEISRGYINQPNHFLIRYEDLVEQPQANLECLCQFIGINFDERMLTDYGATSKQLIRNREAWKAGVSGKIQSTNSQKFYQVFDQAQQAYVLERLSGVNLDNLFNQD